MGSTRVSLDGIERNRCAHVIKLGLINDVRSIDAIVGVIVIVTASAGIANRTLVPGSRTAGGVNRSRNQVVKVDQFCPFKGSCSA